MLYKCGLLIKPETDSHKREVKEGILAYLKHYLQLDVDSVQSDVFGVENSFEKLTPVKSGIADLNSIFKKIGKPFERDKFDNVVNYNWVVDGILRNSMPYETKKSLKMSDFKEKFYEQEKSHRSRLQKKYKKATQKR